MIDHILERTDKGLDIRGRKFPKYTSEYAKAKGSKDVDLRLSSSMLDSLLVIDSIDGEIILGWKDEKERGKAEGNILGSYGKPNPNPSKARVFLGIKEKELQNIIDYVVD